MEPLRISWRVIVDFAALFVASYSLLQLTKLVRALRIVAVLGFVYIMAIAAGRVGLAITARVLEDWVYGMLMLVVVVFQPEIRRSLLRADVFSLRHSRGPSLANRRNREISRAVFALARERVGALIVLLKRTQVQTLLKVALN